MRFTKLRGQHILADEFVAERIVAAAELAPADTVLEVGPGLGVLTRRIIPLAGRYVGVELDPRFVQELKKEFLHPSPAHSGALPPLGGRENIEFIEGDILKINIKDIISTSSSVILAKAGIHGVASKLDSRFHGNDRGGGNENLYPLSATRYTLVSNLPYNITSAFFKKILTEKDPPERIVVMIQNEVAERIRPRSTNRVPRSNLLGLMCNLYAECEYLFRVPKSAFRPLPKVESAVIRLKPYLNAAFSAKWGAERARAEEIIAFIAVFFKDPRRMMRNAFGRGQAEIIEKALISIGERPDSRPADLSLQKWVLFWKNYRLSG